MRAGLIVAGGRSTRFGEADKAIAPLAGVPMIRRVADRLAAVVDAIVVNCRPDQRTAIADALEGLDPPPAFRLDENPDRGPLAGIATGLRDVPATYSAVVACDMPFLDPDLLRHLFDRAADRDAAVPRVDGWDEPLHGVYRTAAMREACLAALDRGDDRIVRALEPLSVVRIDATEMDAVGSRRSFENINTPDAFAAANEEMDTGEDSH